MPQNPQDSEFHAREILRPQIELQRSIAWVDPCPFPSAQLPFFCALLHDHDVESLPIIIHRLSFLHVSVVPNG